jgi:copper resistance protein B
MSPLRWKRWRLAGAAALTLAGLPDAASGQVSDQARYLFIFADNFEQAPAFSGSPVRLEGDLWYGGSYNRLWMKVDGDADTEGGDGQLEAQALFSRLVAPYWDVQIGLRLDALWGEESRSRGHLALGIQGLAPYWFELETTLFVSTEGDVSASLQASYDLLFTQRLVLEPEVEVNASFQEQAEWGLGSGITDTELGLRLRYEIRREFAPYVGYVWARNFGGTADFLRTAGFARRQGSLVAGLRMWY